MDTRPWIVMKFGGTSVGLADRMRQVVRIIRETQTHARPVVVLSAMSSHRKSEGTTTRLLAAADECLKPHSKRHLSIVDALEREHLAAADAAVDQVDLRRQLKLDVSHEFQRLKSFLEAAEIIDEISPKSRDIVISTGEKLSCRIFTAALQSSGIPAVFVPLDRCVDIHVDEAHLDQHFYDYLKHRSASIVLESACSSSFMVPVVTGFIGHIPGGILEAIGRGYTDFTAALVAAGLKTLHVQNEILSLNLHEPQSVSELQIWKEVDGIFTADPRKVPSAQLLPSIYPDEAAELTYYGSEVIHPFTMEQVIRARVPIRIKNTFKPEAGGTAILLEDDYEASTRITPIPPLSQVAADMHTHPHTITATACTLKSDVLVLNIHSNRKSVSHGFLAKVFTCLDRYGVVVDLISTSEVHVSLVTSASSLGLSNSGSSDTSRNSSTELCASTSLPPEDPSASPVLQSALTIQRTKLDMVVRELQQLGELSVLRNMVILSLVGKRMRNMVGIAGKMFSVLAHENVNIEMISQGASEVNISCVVLESDAERALRAVHDHCVLGMELAS